MLAERGAEVERIMRIDAPNAEFDVAFNPEFYAKALRSTRRSRKEQRRSGAGIDTRS